MTGRRARPIATAAKAVARAAAGAEVRAAKVGRAVPDPQVVLPDQVMGARVDDEARTPRRVKAAATAARTADRRTAPRTGDVPPAVTIAGM